MRKLLLITLLAVALPDSAAAARKYRVYINSVPAGASIYVGSRDAGIRGTTRARLYLTRGAHKIILELPGYQTATKTIQVQRRASFTFTLTKAVPRATLSLSLAGGDTSGTKISINGRGHGALPRSIQVMAGRHMVEVTKAGHETWRQWVDLRGGENRQITVTLKATAAKVGAVLVSAPAPGAKISVDGKPAGASPALVEGLSVGPHTVEVSAPDHQATVKVVNVEQGKTSRVAINLVASKKAPAAGSLQVLAEPATAEIHVDGKPAGRAPVKMDKLLAGTHLVEARLAGYETASQQVTISEGKLATIKLKLSPVKKAAPAPAAPVTGTVMFEGTPAGAMASVDGAPAAALAATGLKLSPGDHTLKITAAGYEPLTRSVKVVAGTILRLEVAMKAAGAAAKAETTPAKADAAGSADKAAATDSSAASSADASSADASSADATDSSADDSDDDEPEPVEVRGLSSFGARLVPPKYFTADISAGFPYFLEGRLTTGVFDMGHLGLDAGIELKSMFALTEIGVHAKFRVVRFDPFTAAAFVGIGGGGGPGSRDTFYFNAGLLLSLSFKDIVTFTGRFYANVTSDRLCPSSREDGELDVCDVVPGTTGLDQDPRERFVGGRFVMSAILEVPVTEMIGIFGMVEGAPGMPQREIFTDAFYSLMPAADARIYGRAGISLKF